MTPEFDKEHYKHLKEMAKAYKVHIVNHINVSELVDDGLKYNGFTVAFSPATELDDNRMIEVAVSYCAVEDKFKKKIGKYHALRKFFEENNYVHLPLGEMYRTWGVADTGELLVNMFAV